MGRTSEGSDDNPGRFASGFAMERDGMCGHSLVDHTFDNMLSPPP